MRPATERRIFQSVVAVLALLPLFAGIVGVATGPGFLGIKPPWPNDLDSHVRFLSGVFLAMALAWYACIPGIERNGTLFRLLAVFTMAGGIARLLSLVLVGPPSAGHLVGQVMELLVVPVLVAWQWRLARLFH